MPKNIKSNLKRLQRGQGALEYALMILLIAIVSVPIVTMLAAPDDWREGIIYNQIYLPILCAVQGRQNDCTDRFLYDYPTTTSQKDLGESGGGPGSGDTDDDEDTLSIVKIAIQGYPTAEVPPGNYTVLVEVAGAPETLLLELYNSVDDSVVGSWGSSQVGDGSIPQTFTFANQDFTTEGDFYIQATADKTDVAPVALQLDVNVDSANDPNDAANLIPGGFQLYDPATDTLIDSVRSSPQTEIEEGTYEVRGLIVGGEPASVEMTMTGPGGFNRTVTDTTAPYTLYGDDTDPYIGTALAQGTYTLTLTAYDAEGDAGLTSTPISFVVNPPPDPIFVTGIQWVTVDGSTSNVEGALNEGDTIQVLNDVGFVAQTSSDDADVQSVKFELSQNGSGIDTGVDTGSPYTIYGDSSGNYSGRALPPGDYTLTATAYRTVDQTGVPSPSFTVNFTIIDDGPQVTEILLIDASTNQSLGALTPGMRLSKWTDISFEAITNDKTQSVEIIITGRNATSYNNSQNEGAKPFSAFGDSNGNFGGRTLSDGDYRISVIPHDVDKNNQTGASAGTSLDIDFEVNAGACPVYDVYVQQSGCQGDQVTWRGIQIELTTSCGPNTEVSIGSPLNAGTKDWGGVQDWDANELQQTWNHGWYMGTGGSSGGHSLQTLNDICDGITPLDVQVIYGDGTVENYNWDGNVGALYRD